jgi:hypothetical protein
MTLHEEMQALREKQRVIGDGYRLFHDGTIKTATVTDSLEPGWYILARSIPGASIVFRHHFEADAEGLFLRVEGMREAIALRDRMLEHVVELRVQRQFEADLQEEQHQPEPGNFPVTF